MNRTMIAGLGLLLCTAGAHAQTTQYEHARYDFPFVVNGQEHILTYEGTHDVMRQRDPAVKLVVFVHHGGSQNPVTYFRHMKTALDAAAADRPGLNLGGTTMIISAGMIGDDHIKDNPKRYEGKNFAHWDGGWREGEPSLSKPQVSNFDLLDGMVLHIADRYPNVKAIVHVGHSAGGQLVSRYSFGTPVYDVLRQRGIYVRYIIRTHRRCCISIGSGRISCRAKASLITARRFPCWPKASAVSSTCTNTVSMRWCRT